MALPCVACQQRRRLPTEDEYCQPARDSVEAADAAATVARLDAEATAFAEDGHFRKAAELFARALRIAPREAKLHEARAQCLLELDDVAEACVAAAFATRIRPAWCAGHATLGRAQLNAGRLQDAVDSLTRAVELSAVGEDPDLEADLLAELAEARRLLQLHWTEHHDLVVRFRSDGIEADALAAAPRQSKLQIRQWLECSYCRLSGEQGPGGVVWAAGVVLATFIGSNAPPGPLLQWRGAKVLELGSGTGIGGLAAASRGSEVMLTDRDQLVPLMQLNIDLNHGETEAGAGSARCAAFDWSAPAPAEVSVGPLWDIVVAADLVYSFASVSPLVDTLAALVRPGGAAAGASVLYAHNPRSPELDAELRASLTGHGLRVRDLEMPHLTAPVGRIGLSSLHRVVLWLVDVDPGHTESACTTTGALEATPKLESV
mmetsp:Transcript_29719/g.81381  ORF Transcript_29719/g.81381 Transcript_29719/m.81381 type:complete len:432 (-) Transcript_29719:99-1394(-)